MAHGTDLGISAMADSSEELTVRMLQHVSRTCMREETIRRANAEITDTHGYTDDVFGLCYLLGFSFMPRLKNLAARRLFKPAGSPEEGFFGSRSYAQLDALFSGTSDLNLIAERCEGLVQVAASLKNRVVCAYIIARRLVGSSTSNRLAKALTHLG